MQQQQHRRLQEPLCPRVGRVHRTNGAFNTRSSAGRQCRMQQATNARFSPGNTTASHSRTPEETRPNPHARARSLLLACKEDSALAPNRRSTPSGPAALAHNRSPHLRAPLSTAIPADPVHASNVLAIQNCSS
eukprot:1085296-Alexandrium_andersonii.AAC.1